MSPCVVNNPGRAQTGIRRSSDAGGGPPPAWTPDGQKRCAWCLGSELYVRYHDEEWGVPVHDDRVLFEFLILEGAQAGLSWSTILNKRANYRRAFDGFDPERIARYGARKKARPARRRGNRP